jgi:polyisoprenoid-binding protein YceI
MRSRLRVRSAVASALAIVTWAAVPFASTDPPLAIDSARITIAGTSNIHAYTASTTAIRVVQSQIGVAQPSTALWESALKPGGVGAFEIAIPAATLSSPKEGLNKNMHKALKVQQHPDIMFRLLRLEPQENGLGRTRAVGVLHIAGAAREIALDLRTQTAGSTLSVKGEVELLMTDYGITPPKAMLGMLRTDPKVKVTFEAVIAIALT